MACCGDFEKRMITKLQTLIEAYADAILQLSLANGIEEYTLNTGQGTQRVKRADVDKLTETMGLMQQQLDAYQARCGNGGAVTMVPLC